MKSRVSAAVAVTVGALLVSVLGGISGFLPMWTTAVAIIVIPTSALARRGSQYALVLLVLATLGETAPAYATIPLALAVVFALLQSSALPVTLTAAAGATVVLYHSEPAALVAALFASVLASISWAHVARRSTTFGVLAFLTSAMALSTISILALAEGQPVVAAVGALSGLSVMVASLIGLRTGTGTVRIAAALATAVVVALPVALTSNNADQADQLTASSPTIAALAECPETGNQTLRAVECYAAALIDEYRTNGLQSTVDLVKQVFNAPAPLGGHFSENCHESLHFLGKVVALELTDGNILDAIRKGTDMCSAGFGHGVWEMEYGKMTTQEILDIVPTVCRGWEGYQRSDEGSFGIGCRHILGHTLATRFRGQIENVADYCLIRDPAADPETEMVQDEIISRNNCLAGLFMENNLDLNRFRGSSINESNPFATCEQPKIMSNEVLTWGCYNEIGAMVIPYYDYDMGKALEACRVQATKFDIPEWIKISCYDSMARSVGPALAYEPGAAERVCDSIEAGELRTFCLRGIVGMLVFNSNDVAYGERLCRQKLSGTDLEICLERLSEIKDSLDSSRSESDGEAPEPSGPIPDTGDQPGV